MKRRTLISLPAIALTVGWPLVVAADEGYVAYSRDAYEKAIASGAPLLVDFYAPW